jgi:hypothetical protein
MEAVKSSETSVYFYVIMWVSQKAPISILRQNGVSDAFLLRFTRINYFVLYGSMVT